MNRLLKFITFLGFCCILSLQFGIQAKAALKNEALVKEALVVESHWALDEESALKAYKSSPRHAAVLLNLIKPMNATQEHLHSTFDVFLPDLDETAVGEVWTFDVNGVLPLLRQFHPGATTALSDKLGAVACLRALSPDYAEIIFRFHADFDLKQVELEKMFVELSEASEQKAKLIESKEEAKRLTAVQAEALQGEVEVTESLIAPIREIEKATALKGELASTAEKSEISELMDKLTALSATLTSLEEKLNDRFTELDKKLSELSELTDKLIELSGMLTQLDERLTALERKLDGQFTALEGKLDGKFTVLEEALTKQLDSRLTVLENVLTAREAQLTAHLAQLTAVYFTPTHFTGRLLINRKTRTVAAFSLKIADGEANAVLSTFGRSVPLSVSRMELIDKKNRIFLSDEIKWTTAISVKEAHENLQSKRPKQGVGSAQRLLIPLTR